MSICAYITAYNRLTYLHEYIPVAVVVERVGVEDFELGDVAVTVLVLAHELLVRERLLRVLVQELHV